MPDYQVIIDHALENVWCSPRQDKQYIFKPARVTPRRGAVNRIQVMLEQHHLPLQGVRFHVFQLMSIPESILNIIPSQRWTKVNQICRSRTMLIDVYLAAGLMLPKSECWIKNTKNGSIIIAVRQQRLIEFNLTDDYKDDVLKDNPINVRFYSNSYFSSDRSTDNPREIYVFGLYTDTAVDVQTVAQVISEYSGRVGKVYGFINGKVYPNIRVADVIRDAYVEILYDSSIKYVYKLPYRDLPRFTSDISNDDRAYLKAPVKDPTIDFYDDIDFWVTDGSDNNEIGHYLNRNNINNVRMMTYSGYSISTASINSVINSTNPAVGNADDVDIIAFVRHSGHERSLLSNRTRSNRFVTLSDSEAALDELNSENDLPINEWKYRILESSAYVRLMQSEYRHIDINLVKDAYGYYTASKALADHATLVVEDSSDGSLSVQLPIGLRASSTIFEYNINGHLLGFHRHTSGSDYAPHDTDCHYVEGVTGLYTDGDLILQNGSVVTLDQDWETRYYSDFSGILGDVTGSSYYVTEGNFSTWQIPSEYNRYAITDKYFFCVERVFAGTDPIIQMEIGYYVGTGPSRTFVPAPVPSAEVDVWLNGRPLVEGIDYHVAWPRVIVSNKTNMTITAESNSLIVRSRGFCNDDLLYVPPKDVGFIKYGIFSQNGMYDVHWDQSLKIVMGGRSVIPSNIFYQVGDRIFDPTLGVFEEESLDLSVERSVDSSGVILRLGIDPDHSLNGLPYSIKDVYTGLTCFVPGSTRDYREEMLDFDNRLSEFLTENITDNPPSVPNSISQRYLLYSPFCAAIMTMLIGGTIDREVWDKHELNLRQTTDATEEWHYLLSGDPTQDNIYENLDEEIIEIHPHPFHEVIDMPFMQYRFLEFIIENMLNGRVDLSRHVRVI